jgi:succinate dehydrogenase / fumarate reductase iron-sulfur subunit
MKLKIWRSGKDGRDARYEVYDIRSTPGMSVLEALFAVQDEYDDSLAFRYSCRGAVCGSCAMSINREPRLACRTQVSRIAETKSLGLRQFPGLARDEPWDKDAEILIEPLPNLRIERDLIVDMTRFYEAYKSMRPWLDDSEGREGIAKMLPNDVSRVEKFANCILCAACFGACPVCEKDQEYVGPAALAWSYRFFDDPREPRKAEKLSLAGERFGAPDCEFVYNCVKVCPKDVAPALAIRKLRDRLDK